MKLAEALIERAELQKENVQLLNRISGNTMVQEGDSPAEDPVELIAKYEENMARFLELVQKINVTNSKTPFNDSMSIADAIAHKDNLGAKHRAYTNIYAAATININRYSNNEIKFVRCLDIKEVQKQVDKLAKEYREIDTKLQGLNWTTILL
ncbi:MAG: DIP1984 family protein [Defluviitaleaceae bacterium]|nr:DIP1984 family protein [Defluviitaleaceae bacterium]